MKKPLLIAGVISTIGIAGLGAGVANAASSTSSEKNPMSGMVDAIATKFNLDKTEVQKVVDAERTEMKAQRETDIKNELATLVKDGKLTQSQSDAIMAKRAELQTEREANKDTKTETTAEERKTTMQAKKTALETWAKEQGIDSSYLKYLMGHGPGGHGGPGQRGDRGDKDASDSSASN